ncbi:unnamed protein product [Symbiodinium sp. CCMP2456]|nr:unnamed protein product [Symbiodinium sp. CCMP2456]
MEEILWKFSISSRGLAVAAAASVACAACAACYRGQESASRRAESRPPRISISSAGSTGSSVASSVVSVQSVHSVQSDAEVEMLQADDSEIDRIKPRLLTNSPDCASSIRFSTRGISVHVQGIEHNTTKSIPISKVVAKHLAGSLPTDARVLKGGRLCRVGRESGEQSVCKLVLDDSSPGRDNSSRLLVCDSVFFNFAAIQWQPLSRRGVYMSPRHMLYCAFVPTDNLLFIKVGYRAMADKRNEAILKYIEQKTKRLRITNIAGAGVFLMPLPKSHEAFKDPARAAEESLKSAIRCSKVLHASPSGSNMEFVTFSSSLEYFLVKSKEGEAREGSALQALTQTLRDFTGDGELRPLRAVATPPSGKYGRSGRRRLLPWSEKLDFLRPRQPPPVAGLARPSSVRSRQFIAKMASNRGAFAHRLSRRLRDPSLPRAKKRRKAKSCP